jgi:hypothetical protein
LRLRAQSTAQQSIIKGQEAGAENIGLGVWQNQPDIRHGNWMGRQALAQLNKSENIFHIFGSISH